MVLKMGLKREVERTREKYGFGEFNILCLFLSTSLHFSLAQYIQNSDNIHISYFIYRGHAPVTPTPLGYNQISII
jgi:hypothetical protein